MKPRATLMLTLFSLMVVSAVARGQQPADDKLFARVNLVAWCIVPFDKLKRGPEARVAMLQKLGFRKYAYDWRSEHLPTFDEEVRLLKAAGIELTAVWFPANLGPEAETLLAVIKKHKVKPQLWITMGGGTAAKTPEEQEAKVREHARVLRPIAERAAELHCQVGLYNHGGWFGEPDNQIAIIRALKMQNLGIVYNLHHGHDHLDQFPELLDRMKPHLLVLNLNGMNPRGDRIGQKILPLGQGSEDLRLMRQIKESGWPGPFGIIGHTQDDVQERLLDNLDGLDWLVKQLARQPAGAKPQLRTPLAGR